MKQFLARIIPPCRDITRFASESMDRPLPLPVRLKLRLHLLICEGCRRYAAQLRAVRKRLRRLSADGGTTTASVQGLSDEAKTRLKKALKEQRE